MNNDNPSQTPQDPNSEAAYQTAQAAGNTHLTYQQWLHVRSPEFKAWFGDWENDPQNASKAVHPETGEPMVVYHTSSWNPLKESEGKAVFRKGTNGGLSGDGIYFSEYPLHQFGSEVTEYFLNIRNPITTESASDERYDSLYENLIDGSMYSHYVYQRGGLKKNWHELAPEFDGVINRNETVVISPNQIKSATHNIGTFSPENPDIRFSVGQTAQDKVKFNLYEGDKTRFARAINGIYSGNFEAKHNRLVDMGTTPDVLQMLGLPNVRVTIRETTIEKAFHNQLDFTQHGHNIAPETLKRFPEQMNNPIAVMHAGKNSDNPDSMLVLTELTETEFLSEQEIERGIQPKEKPVIAAFIINQTFDGMEVINITSIHGRSFNNILDIIQENVKHDRLLYWNKEKGSQFLPVSASTTPPTLRPIVQRLRSGVNLGENCKTETDLVQWQSTHQTRFSLNTDAEQHDRTAELQRTLSAALGGLSQHIRLARSQDTTLPNGETIPPQVEGWYNPQTRQITLLADRMDADTAAFVTWHELGHRQIHVTSWRDWQKAWAKARQNPTVDAIARAIETDRRQVQQPVSRTEATEEAAAELYAAHKTRRYDVLENKYHIQIPAAQRAGFTGYFARLQQKLRGIINRALGKAAPSFTDGQVFQLLNRLDRAKEADFRQPETQFAPTTDLRFSRSASTQQQYEQRIDDLFAGKHFRDQVRVLDRSDLLDMLGYGGMPVVLVNSKVNAPDRKNGGKDPKHQNMTAEIWKKMPEWLDNPAMVFKSDTYPNRLVFIAPESVGSNPIKIIVEPNGESLKAHVLLNAYDMHETAQHQDGRHKGNPFNTFTNWRDRDLLLYIDKEKTRRLASRSELLLQGRLLQPTGLSKILTENNLRGYRKSMDVAQRQPETLSSPDTPKFSFTQRSFVMSNDYAPPTYDEVRTALSYIPTPSGYSDWYPMAYAIKDALGENGKELWHNWSRQGDNYNARTAEATWKSAKPKAGGITAATLFKQARDNGYRPEKPYVAPTPEQRAQIAKERATQNEIWETFHEMRHQSAAKLANTIWRNSKELTAADLAHPYLQSKGIQDLAAVAGIRINRYKGQNKLVIPIYLRNEQTGKTELVNLQQIDANGEKRFLAGGQKSGGYAILNGTKADMKDGFYIAEGYATAASVHLATGKPVIIAFDAGNLPVVAARIAERGNLPADTPVYLAADNDRISQKGLSKAAEATALLGEHAQIRLPEFDVNDIEAWQQRHGQTDSEGKAKFPSDFNDLHEVRGLEAVKATLDTPLSANRMFQVEAMQPEIDRQTEHRQSQDTNPSDNRPEPTETLPLDAAGLRFRAEYVLDKFEHEKQRNALLAELAKQGIDIRGEVDKILAGREAQKQPETEPQRQPETAKPPTSSNIPFTQAVDKVEAGEVPAGYISLGTTTDVLQMLGVPQGKMRISGGTIEKAVADYLNRQNAYDKNRHAVNPEDLKLLPGEMNDPIAVFKSATQSNSFVVLTQLYERENGKEKPVIAAVHLNKGKGKHGADLIDVVSVYGRSDAQLERAFQNDLLYVHNEKVREFLATHPLQLHWDITSEPELFKRNIKTNNDLAQWQNAHRQPENPTPSMAQSPNQTTTPTTNPSQPEKENTMAQQPTPEELRRHAQNVAQITNEADRQVVMDELAERGIHVRGEVNKILAEHEAKMSQQPENEHGEFQPSQNEQPETVVSPTFADELSALNLPSDFSFEYQVLPPYGREIARIHLEGYGGEIMVDKIEADKGGGYVASFDKVLDGKPIHLDNLSTLMREMTFQMRQAAERERRPHQEPTAAQSQRQPETAQPPEPAQPTAADNAAVAVSEPLEKQTVEQPQNQQENTMPTPETNLVLPTREAAVEYEAINRVMQASTLAEMNRIEPRPDGVTDVAQYLQEQLAKNKEQLAHETDNAQREALQDDIAVGEIAVSLAQQGLSSQQLQQRAETLLAEAQRVPAAEVENSIEFGGIMQEQAQSPAQPAEAQPQLETISAAEVQENLRRAKEKERIEQAQQFLQETAAGAAVGIAADAALDAAIPGSSMAKTATGVAAGFAGDAAAERALWDDSVQSSGQNAPDNTERQPETNHPKPVLDHGYDAPANIKARYIQTNSRFSGHLNYSDINSHETVVFQDKGSKLSTPKNDAQTVSDMLDVAQTKNWGSIKISGSKEFKQQMWLEANLRGIATSGYKPSKEDLALLDHKREERSRNSIEHQPNAPERNKSTPAMPSQARTDSLDFAPLHSEADKRVKQAQTPEQQLQAVQTQERVTAGAAQAEQAKDNQQNVPEPASQDKTNALMDAYHKKLNRLSKDDMAMIRKVEVGYLQVLEQMPHKNPDERELMRRSVYQALGNMIQGNKLTIPHLEPSQQQQAQHQELAGKGKGKDKGMGMSD